MQFNLAQKEITIKVVYYGPPLSGKTTNLQELHRLLSKRQSGRITKLNTSDDRTLFFDMMPVVIKSETGYQVKLKLFTVPGQVVHAATRRLVLQGADGIVFVADSRQQEARVNNQYWHGMRQYLEESGFEPGDVPTVIQFNKCDMPDSRSKEDLDRMREISPNPVYNAVAVRGLGVLETLRGVLELVFDDLNQRYDFEQKFGLVTSRVIESIFSEASAPGDGAKSGVEA